MSRNDKPIYPSQLSADPSLEEILRMLRSWRGRSNVPGDVRAIQSVYSALVELHGRYRAAHNEVQTLYSVIDRMRKITTVETDTLIQEVERRECMPRLLTDLMRKHGPTPQDRADPKQEVIDQHKDEYHRHQHIQDREEQAGVGRRTVEGQQRRAAEERAREVSR